MPRYVAFLRGVSPMNASMTQLKACFEAAGFTDVRTVLSSGNIAFTAKAKSERVLARQAEAAMAQHLDRAFLTIVRAAPYLQKLVKTDPYAAFRLAPKAKRVVTFLSDPAQTKLSLPPETDGVRMLTMSDREIFTAYVPGPRGPMFMTLIEKTFGKNVTTRTWDTVKKCAVA
jgi:uncharacterized protein (DUF1697 family)